MDIMHYGWLLVWLFVGEIILRRLFCGTGRLDEADRAPWGLLPALLLVLPYILWAGFRSDAFGDTPVYRSAYLALKPTFQTLRDAFFGQDKDPGYILYSVLLKWLLGNRDKLFFLVTAAVQLVCIALVFRRYGRDYWTCIFLFVASTDYISWMHNGTRQFLAVAIIFAGFRFLLEKRYVPIILLILAAALFHWSALLMLPVLFLIQGKAWNRKIWAMLAVTVVFMVFANRLIPLLEPLLDNTHYENLTENELWQTDDGTSLLRVLVYSIPALLSLAGLQYVRQADDPVMNLCVNASVVTMALYLVSAVSSGIYIGRLPIYTTLFGYMALPWLIDRIFEKRSAKFLRWCMYGAYLLFFYYQMHFGWKLL